MDIALFSPSSIFADGDGNTSDAESNDVVENYVERSHNFPGMELVIREFSFHQLNANLLWPGTFALAEWLVQHRSWIEGRRVIELGSGTGALAIFLRKSLQLDITTSDYDDQEIEDNIAYNCRVNGLVQSLPHIKHTWGDIFPTQPDWDLIVASDILLCKCSKSDFFLIYNDCESHKPDHHIWVCESSVHAGWEAEPIVLLVGKTHVQQFHLDKYVEIWMCTKPICLLLKLKISPILSFLLPLLLKDVKQYPKLIKTISFLLKTCASKSSAAISRSGIQQNCGLPYPAFLMSWRRRIGKEDEGLFFKGCEQSDLEVQHLGSRVYCIKPRDGRI